MSDADGAVTDWGSVVVTLVLVLGGVCLLGGLVYVELTATVSRAEYEAFSENCEGLAGETRLTETGIGLDQRELNESAVAACRNTTFAQFRQSRIDSMWEAPLNPFQWAWFGGFGLLLALGGGYLLRQQLPLERVR